jgi:hypothetical protein
MKYKKQIEFAQETYKKRLSESIKTPIQENRFEESKSIQEIIDSLPVLFP